MSKFDIRPQFECQNKISNVKFDIRPLFECQNRISNVHVRYSARIRMSINEKRKTKSKQTSPLIEYRKTKNKLTSPCCQNSTFSATGVLCIRFRSEECVYYTGKWNRKPKQVQSANVDPLETSFSNANCRGNRKYS